MNPDDQALIPQAMELLKNNPMRTFRVEVATDSMLYADEQQEKADRVEFLTSTSAFIEKAVQAAQVAPEITPLILDLLKFGVTGYRVGRTIEGEVDNVADKMKQIAAQPKPQQPSPEQMKAQAEMQKMQAEMQLEQMKMQLEQQKLEFEKWKVQMDNDTKVIIAEMAAKKDIKTTAMNINGAKEAEGLTELDDMGVEQPTSALQGLVEAINANMAVMTQAQAQHNQDILMQQQMAHQNLVQQLTKPKQVVRDANGKILGVQ